MNLRRVLRYCAILLTLAVMGAGAAILYLQGLGVAPRQLARYLEHRGEGHRPLLTASVGWVAGKLQRLDRGAGAGMPIPAALPGVPAATARPPATREVLVSNAAEVEQAVARAEPGDVLTLLPGIYRFGQSVYLSRAGRPGAPIMLRAQRAGKVTIEFDTTQGFFVTAPDWTVENLAIHGACAQQARCEHAFHVVGAAQRFVARGNTITDFNAHFKINGEDGRFPDHGLIENNVLNNASVRQVDAAVAPIDLVGASDWTVRGNLISDFVKTGGDGISYGGFFKGGGSRNRFERNVVLCEHRLRDAPGQRVGLSLGGGGSGKQFCRDRSCVTEQNEGVIEANLVASCSDDGIYLNSAARSRVVHNTVLDTAGIEGRFATTGADVEGNLVDGIIHARNDAVLRLHDNHATVGAMLYLGWHPVRHLFAADALAPLAWEGAPPRRAAPAGAVAELCGRPRPALAALGAFEEFGACRAAAR